MSNLYQAFSSLKKKINAAYVGKWVFIGSLIGVIAGLGAIVLYTLINVFNYLILFNIGRIDLLLQGRECLIEV